MLLNPTFRRNPLAAIHFPTNPNVWLKHAFVFFCFFPFLKVVPFLKTDVQPYTLLCSLVLLLIWIPRYINIGLLLPLFVATVAFAIISFNGLTVAGLRNSFGYFSFLTVSYASYKYLITQQKLPYRFITIAVYVWMAIAIIHHIFPDFLTFLLPRSRTGYGRGVTSLAPEPTHYGIACLFFMLIIDMCQHPKRKLLNRLLIFQIIFLARSSTVILFLIILFGLRTIVKLNGKRLLISIATVVIGIIVLMSMDLRSYNIRVFKIIDLVIERGFLKTIAIDASISDRVAHIYFSLKGFLDNYFLPHGYGAWGKYLDGQLAGYGRVFRLEWITRGDKILSTYGAAFYELGIFGLLLPVSITIILYRAFKKSEWRRQLTLIIFVNMILMTAIPISFPPIAFLMGAAIYRSKLISEDIINT